MAAKKKVKRSGARKPKRAGRPVKRIRASAKPKVQPVESGERLLIDVSPLNPPQNSFATPYPRDFNLIFHNHGSKIAKWLQERNAPLLLTGGAVEPVPVPFRSFPPVAPQPDLSRTAGPGLDQVSPIPDLAGLNHEEAVEVIKEWFLSNFDDPAQSTPRNDGEFLFIAGGPYDACEEISDAFSGNVPEEIIEAAIRAVEDEGIDEWAPHGNRVRPDYDEQAEVAASDANTLHAEMIGRIETLEKAIADLQERQRHGIGHNNPPEPIEPAPLSANELSEIREALAALKNQPSIPNASSAEAAKAAVTVLQKFGNRLRAMGVYIGKHADVFVTEAAKKAGEEAGKRIVQSPLWLAIIHQLPAVADIASKWLHSLPHF